MIITLTFSFIVMSTSPPCTKSKLLVQYKLSNTCVGIKVGIKSRMWVNSTKYHTQIITQCNKFRSCHVHDWKITLSYSICPEKILFFCEKLILCSIFEQNSIKVRKNSVLGGFRDTPHPPMGVIEFFGFLQKLP